MPKRRKAPKRAATVESEDEAATEVHEPTARWTVAQTGGPDSEVQLKAQGIIDELECAVQDKIASLLRMADDAAASMNNELIVQLVKIPKQIRSMKLLEFQEKHAGDLTGPALEEIKSRHQALQLHQAAPPTTGAKIAGTVTRTTRKRAATALPAGDAGPVAQRATRSRAGRPPRAPAPTLATVAEDEEEEEQPDEDTEAPPGSSHAADLKPNSRQRVMATPLPGGGVMQTPLLPGWKGAQFGGAFATVVKKAGRGAKTNAGNAIVITCADGEQIAVDMLNGLASVPDSRRQEVQQQLSQLKSLAEAALR